VHLFWGDERHVPPDHQDSNFGMANEAMVKHVPVPASQVHRMRGEMPDAREAAAEYEGAVPPDPFDVMLLGLGEDAHIASIFPGGPLLPQVGLGSHPSSKYDLGDGATQGWAGDRAAAVWAPHLNSWRITLTPPALLNSRQIVMLVAGEAKAGAVAAALEADEDVRRWPAQLLRGAPVDWLIDRPAARGLRALPPA
jgi:6-phosphogluconolactonase